MKRWFQRTQWIELLTGLLFLLMTVTVLLVHLRPGMERYAPSVNSFRILTPDRVEEVSIPDYAGVRRVYTFTLPKDNPTGARIRCYLRHTFSTFYLEDSTRAERPPETEGYHIGHTPGNYWLTIPMSSAFPSETMHIVLTPAYSSARNEEPVFYFIDRDILLTMIVLPEDRFLLFLSAIAVTAGLFLCVLAFTPPLTGSYRRRLFYMGATTVCAGIWKLTALPTTALLLDYLNLQKEVWFIGALSYLLMLVLSLRLLTSMRTGREYRVGQICVFVGAATAAAITLLQLLDLVELHEILIWYGFGMAALHFISLFGEKPTRTELFWLFPFFLSLGLDLVLLLVQGTMQKAPVFLIWIVLNLFIRGFGFVREDVEHKRQLKKQEDELREARIRSMINEIRPHFIYNTLSSIYMLCRDDPKRAQEVIGNFTTYLQANFTAISSTEPVPFTREMEHTRAYLAVESVLYEGKLSVTYDTAFSAFRLPPLTLQPVVENSIKYSVGKGLEHVHIIIRTARKEDGIELIVEDDGTGVDPQVLSLSDEAAVKPAGDSLSYQESPAVYPGPDSAPHIGLQNVTERLKIMCGGTLSLNPREGGGTIVRIFLPDGVR